VAKCNTVTAVSDKATAMGDCLNEHNCLPLPFPMNDVCSPPKHGLKFNMSTLARGKPWWVVYGNSRIADCVSCQRRHIYAENETTWWYNYTTLLPTGHGNYENFTLHTPLAPTAEQKHSMDSWKWPWGGGGLNFVEQWWLVDDADSYLQIYYCATLLGHGDHGVLEGGLILSAEGPSVPAAALPKIRANYAAMGVDFANYCNVDNSCKPPAPALTASAQPEIII